MRTVKTQSFNSSWVFFRGHLIHKNTKTPAFGKMLQWQFSDCKACPEQLACYFFTELASGLEFHSLVSTVVSFLSCLSDRDRKTLEQCRDYTDPNIIDVI